MSSSNCAVCGSPKRYVRGVCKKCYDVAYYWKKNKLPKDELHAFLRFRRKKLSSSGNSFIYKDEVESYVSELPDIELYDTGVNQDKTAVSLIDVENNELDFVVDTTPQTKEKRDYSNIKIEHLEFVKLKPNLLFRIISWFSRNIP